MNALTEAAVARIVAEQLDADLGAVTPASSLEDLGADSLDRIEIIMELEHRFGIEISDEEGEKLLTVQQAAELVEEKSRA